MKTDKEKFNTDSIAETSKNAVEAKKTESKKKGGVPIQSINRAIQILKCFETSNQLTLAEICEKVQLHKSTVYGIVATLKENGFLDKDEVLSSYRLGIELYKLASHVNRDIRSVCQPFVHELCEITGETVNLVVPDDNYVIYIEKCESKYSMRISTNIGTRLPMYCTAVGKAIMAFMPDQTSVSQILDQTQLKAYTKNTLTNKEAILKSLHEIRQCGYAIDNEELEYGLVCVAVPILDVTGSPVAAVSCSGPIQRMTPDNIDEIAKAVIRYALKMSSRILY
ncbi:MAG: IclR family transcriptional regulator [Lachnospiraceae bacterium]|nr:IclR family transcriptional regulator [Lachnospiraceae bacterium]